MGVCILFLILGTQSPDRNVFGKSCQRPIEFKEFLERNRSPKFVVLSLVGEGHMLIL